MTLLLLLLTINNRILPSFRKSHIPLDLSRQLTLRNIPHKLRQIDLIHTLTRQQRPRLHIPTRSLLTFQRRSKSHQRINHPHNLRHIHAIAPLKPIPKLLQINHQRLARQPQLRQRNLRRANPLHGVHEIVRLVDDDHMPLQGYPQRLARALL